jgi:hypothetical protein
LTIQVAYIGAYATDVLATQQVFYHQKLPWAYQILLILGTQTFGFSLGGILRQFVVYPSSMIWPSALVSSSLFNTLHSNYGKRDRGHMTRERFFFIACAASFVWYWVPGYLFTALSVFNWVCWIAPNNVTVNALFGSSTGLGMSILTFDWGMISFIGSPLVTPVRFPLFFGALHLMTLLAVVVHHEYHFICDNMLLVYCPYHLLCVFQSLSLSRSR